MKKKNNIVNLNALTDVTEGEIVTKTDEKPVPAVDNAVKTTLDHAKVVADNNDKQQELQILLAEVLKKHQEKGSLAVDILKSAINQKIETLLHGTVSFDLLVKQAYALADAFKTEMDNRYTSDVTETTNKLFGIKPASETKTEDKQSKKLN